MVIHDGSQNGKCIEVSNVSYSITMKTGCITNISCYYDNGLYIYCILHGRIKGFNISITRYTILFEVVSYRTVVGVTECWSSFRTVVLLTHFIKETCLFIQ